ARIGADGVRWMTDRGARALRDFAVDGATGAREHHALHVGADSGLEDVHRADDVYLRVAVGLSRADGDTGLRALVGDHLGAQLLAESVRPSRVAEISEAKDGALGDVRTPTRAEVVEDVHLVAACEEQIGDVAAD